MFVCGVCVVCVWGGGGGGVCVCVGGGGVASLTGDKIITHVVSEWV